MPGLKPVPNELVEADGVQLYVYGVVPPTASIVLEPVAFVHVACEVIFVTVGFGEICK